VERQLNNKYSIAFLQRKSEPGRTSRKRGVQQYTPFDVDLHPTLLSGFQTKPSLGQESTKTTTPITILLITTITKPVTTVLPLTPRRFNEMKMLQSGLLEWDNDSSNVVQHVRGI